MISRRLVIAAAALAVPATIVPTIGKAADGAAAAAVISSFYDTLLSVMKDGMTLGFAGRSQRLAPAVRLAFDLPLMTRLMVGPQWANFTPPQQEQLVAAFSDFSVATYANRFEDYSGEQFEVDRDPTATGDAVIVHTRLLIKSLGEPVQIDYLMRQRDGLWQIIDVYLSGTVSELATRRSEFSSILRRGGPEALVELLLKKTAQLRG